MTIVCAFISSLLFFTIMGVPIGFAISMSSVVIMSLTSNNNPMIFARRFVTGVDMYTLMAIPLFMLTGEIMSKAGLLEDIVDFAKTITGKIRGGLAQVNIVTSMLFAGISGSAVADAAGEATILIPLMEKAGYDKKFSCAITAASSVIGPIFPPSIPMIVLGAIAEISVSKLFLGGVIPGVLVGCSLMVYTHIVASKRKYPIGDAVSIKEFFKSLRKALWALVLPLIILGGILSGIFTATEASAVAAVYATTVAIMVYKVEIKEFPELLSNAAISTGVVMLVCGAAMSLTWFLAVAQVPQLLTEFLMGITSNKYVFLLLVNILLFLVGMIIDLTPALFLFVPILLPISKSFGIDPIHFSVIMVVNLCVGLITPPVGTVLYVINSITKIKLEELVVEMMPMFLVLIITLLLITYLPDLVLWLPSIF